MLHSAEIEIVFEDNHLLIVNKPPLLPTMGSGPGEDSLLRRAKQSLAVRYSKPGNVYLGVVSRLDAHTSGLVVFARTSKAAARLNRQFAARQVLKKYLAVVPNSAPDQGHWEDLLWKNESQHRMQVVDRQHPHAQQATTAELKFAKLAENRQQQLVDVDLLTGRKHQIRVQFSARGFPIVGDRKYGSPEPFARGIALHAYYLSFAHPVGGRAMIFLQTPPENWPFGGIIGRHLQRISREQQSNV